MPKFIFIISLACISSVYGLSIQTKNTILTQVGEKAITVLDIKKEMDRHIYTTDEKMFSNINATYAYYAQNWKGVLQKVLQDEILLLEAEKLSYTIPSHDITKKVSEMFGDNNVRTCKHLSISPERAREICNREIISSHLSWYRIWIKSSLEATPKNVMAAYKKHVEDLAKKDTWTYQVIYVKGQDEHLVQEASSQITALLKEGEYTNLSLILDRMNIKKSDVKIAVSKDITLQTNQISSSLLTVLKTLEEGMISDVITGKNRAAYTGKFLQLKNYKKEHIPEFTKLSENLKNTIMNELGAKIATEYFEILYKRYDIAGLYGTDLTKSTLEPFSLQND